MSIKLITPRFHWRSYFGSVLPMTLWQGERRERFQFCSSHLPLFPRCPHWAGESSPWGGAPGPSIPSPSRWLYLPPVPCWAHRPDLGRALCVLDWKTPFPFHEIPLETSEEPHLQALIQVWSMAENNFIGFPKRIQLNCGHSDSVDLEFK